MGGKKGLVLLVVRRLLLGQLRCLCLGACEISLWVICVRVRTCAADEHIERQTRGGEGGREGGREGAAAAGKGGRRLRAT